MNAMGKIFLQTLIILLMSGCASFPPAVDRNEQSLIAVEVSNKALDQTNEYNIAGNIPSRVLKEIAARSLLFKNDEKISLTNVSLSFGRQAIEIRADILFQDIESNTKYAGHIRGAFSVALSGSELIWLPSFDRIKIKKARVNGTKLYVVLPLGNIVVDLLLKRINGYIAKQLLDTDRNRISINISPLKIFDQRAVIKRDGVLTSLKANIPLEGIFVITHSALLIDKKGIAFVAVAQFDALENECRERNATLDPDQMLPTVYRAYFAKSIDGNEPIESATIYSKNEPLYFFTEIKTDRIEKVSYRWRQNNKVSDQNIFVEVKPTGVTRGWRSKTSKVNFIESDNIVVDVRIISKEGCLLTRKSTIVLSVVEWFETYLAYFIRRL